MPVFPSAGAGSGLAATDAVGPDYPISGDFPFSEPAHSLFLRRTTPHQQQQRRVGFYPDSPDGLLRECAWALCDFLNASPSDLWSDAQLQPLEKNHSSIDLDADSVQALACGTAATDPLRLASHAQAGRIIQDALDSLTPREANVIRERFFSDSSLEEIAERMGVTRERVRQIEIKALRKLRHESRIPHELGGIADVIGGAADA